MRKYLATIFGVAVGMAAAVFVAARSHESEPDRRTSAGGQEGGA